MRNSIDNGKNSKNNWINSTRISISSAQRVIKIRKTNTREITRNGPTIWMMMKRTGITMIIHGTKKMLMIGKHKKLSRNSTSKTKRDINTLEMKRKMMIILGIKRMLTTGRPKTQSESTTRNMVR